MNEYSNGDRMTPADRKELDKLIRLQAQAAKQRIIAREAEQNAEFEQQIASIYSPADDEVWAQAKEEANVWVEEAEREIGAKVRARCDELGIPREFRPNLSFHCFWSSRGENAENERRVELRRVAKSRFASHAKQAKAEVEAYATELRMAIVADALETKEARAFLAQIPSVIEKLMPAPTEADVKEIEAQVPKRRGW
jgi:hypothetical protein